MKKERKIWKIFGTLALALCFLLGGFDISLAQDGYTLLEPLPGVPVNEAGEADPGQYISGLFTLIIGIAGVLAVFMIIFGGIQYMSTDAFSGKSEAKATIENAIWGLLLALGAWMILNTINPNLVGFDLELKRVETPVNTNVPGGGGSLSSLSHAEVMAQLAPGITPYAGQCTGNNTTGCVNLGGLQPATINGLNSLKSQCSQCTISISGGTEGGHTSGGTHGQGRGVDVLSNGALNDFIRNGRPLSACQRYSRQGVPGSFLWEPEGATCGGVRSSGDHWHITY